MGGDGITASKHFRTTDWPYVKSKATMAMVCNNDICNEIIAARDAISGESVAQPRPASAGPDSDAMSSEFASEYSGSPSHDPESSKPRTRSSGGGRSVSNG
jgi:hypothetical protein